MKITIQTAHDVVWNKARKLLPVESAFGKGSEFIIRFIREVEQIREQTAKFIKHKNLICWLETDKTKIRLSSMPKELEKRLFDDQWKKGVATILTSGTLSAGGDFSHIKRTLGLNYLKSRITETSKLSPFNYKENVLLYISRNMPFPNNKSKFYIIAITNEVERLIRATHGHTAVLFTSYKVMDMVWEQLEQQKIQFPMFRFDKGGIGEIKRFKQSKGGVLLASGALWEGIDIPGDALSMLIIVKLPFAVPDPVSEHEQTQYPDFATYRESVIVPEMLIKLKQGFGRLIRTETDTGVVAILDSRADKNGSYRKQVLETLPKCRVTDDIEEVKNFIITKKSPEYYCI